jgi:hypothetical protein
MHRKSPLLHLHPGSVSTAIAATILSVVSLPFLAGLKRGRNDFADRGYSNGSKPCDSFKAAGARAQMQASSTVSSDSSTAKLRCDERQEGPIEQTRRESIVLH